MNTRPPTPPPEPLLITELEASRLLGLHSKTLYLMRKRGQIPFLKAGASVRYSPAALRAWIAEKSKGGVR